MKSRRKSEVVLKKRFDSKALLDEICLKAKIKSDDGKVNTNCYDNEFLKKSCNCIFQSLIFIDFVIGTSKNCYSQILLEEWKHNFKEKKITPQIADDIETSPDDDDDDDDDDSNNEDSQKNIVILIYLINILKDLS